MKNEASPLVIPTGDWTFKNMNVAQNFDNHVREQLPWYDLVTGIVTHVGRHYLPENGRMYDIGASTGNITKNLAREILGRSVKAVSIDYSKEMESLWDGVGTFEVADARNYAFENFDFAVCFLVLMFLPPVEQRVLVDLLVKNIKEGGALLIIDKTEAPQGYIGTVMHRLTLAGKIANGASADAVIQKELSLAGIQRPIIPTALLSRHGAVEIFRFGEFAGWVISG